MVRAAEGQKEVWVYLEKGKNGIHENSLRILPECRKLSEGLGTRLSGILIGHEVKYLAPSIPGELVGKTYCIDNASVREYNVQVYSSILFKLVNNYEPLGIILAASPGGRDLAPRLARKLGRSVIANCTALEVGEGSKITARKPIYGGNVDAIVTPLQKPFVVTLNQRVFELESIDYGQETLLDEVHIDLVPVVFSCGVIGRVNVDPKKLDLSEAEIVIGIGRGININQLEMIEELGQLFRATIGGTRPAVDEGWVTPERQIGVSGKHISPNLYLAFGISGAPHHLAGVRDSKYIIAINNDSAAPIFKVADLGIVGRVEEVMPPLIAQMKNYQKKE